MVSYYAVRLAPEEVSTKLTGYEHNGVTCIGMKTDIPVIKYLLFFSPMQKKGSISEFKFLLTC